MKAINVEYYIEVQTPGFGVPCGVASERCWLRPQAGKRRYLANLCTPPKPACDEVRFRSPIPGKASPTPLPAVLPPVDRTEHMHSPGRALLPAGRLRRSPDRFRSRSVVFLHSGRPALRHGQAGAPYRCLRLSGKLGPLRLRRPPRLHRGLRPFPRIPDRRRGVHADGRRIENPARHAGRP